MYDIPFLHRMNININGKKLTTKCDGKKLTNYNRSLVRKLKIELFVAETLVLLRGNSTLLYPAILHRMVSIRTRSYTVGNYFTSRQNHFLTTGMNIPKQ